jgi:hypothetical protein
VNSVPVRSSLSAVVLAVLVVTVAACTADSEGDDPGELRIDGPAQVDPDFDPFATVPATTGG